MAKGALIAKQYDFPIGNYISPERLERIKAFAADKETPCLVLDLDVIRAKYEELRAAFPFAKVYYSVHANPHEEVLSLLGDLGARFDVSSRYELDRVLALGLSPDRVLFGNTVKKRADIAYAYAKGVRLYATDSMTDLSAISGAAPGSRVYFRLLVDGLGADLPSSKKIGCQPDLIRQLVKTAVRFGLVPYGISFHTGDQQRDVGQWSTAITATGHLFRSIREEIHVDLAMIDIGGGFPASYLEPADSLGQYAENISRFLDNNFKDVWPQEILIEPGRYLVGDAGVIVSEIVNIAKKSMRERYTWVFLDVGKFGGLIETTREAIKYPICFEGSGKAVDVILAGPTTDPLDVLYEKWSYTMPESAKIGDRAYILTTGAYTHSYSSVGCDGFPPLQVQILR